MVSQSVYKAPSTTWTSGDRVARARSWPCSTAYRYAPGYRRSKKKNPGPPGGRGPGGRGKRNDLEIGTAFRVVQRIGRYERRYTLAGSALSSIRLTRT